MSVTLVTCYYEFKSKHSNEDYRNWAKNLRGIELRKFGNTST